MHLLIEEATAIARLQLGRALTASDPVFPSPKGPARSVERLSLGRAMARLIEAAGMQNATPHDLRRTGATLLASERIGVLLEVIARILNHAPLGGSVIQIYNRHAYVREKRSALESLSDLIVGLVVRRAM